jgi:hypothetical membrane protein
MKQDVVRVIDCFEQLQQALSDLGLEHISNVVFELQELALEELDIEVD